MSNGDRPLDGAVALVTGAARGLGKGIAVALTVAGARVIGADIADRPADLDVAEWLRHDVTSEVDWQNAADTARERFGRLDCVVNNAGILVLDPIEDTTLETWRRVQAINVESVLLSFRALLPLLRESGAQRSGGSAVVNVSSPSALVGSAFGVAYTASKAAMTNFSKTAAKEFSLLGYPIRVNTLYPGAGSAMGMAMSAPFRKRLSELGALPKDVAGVTEDAPAAVDIAEIAAGVVFLCSPAASQVSGIDLPMLGDIMPTYRPSVPQS